MYDGWKKSRAHTME
jgi:hypothetical protein